MVILANKIIFDANTSYKTTSIVTCCGKMEKCDSIDLCLEYDEFDSEYKYGVKLHRNERYYSYGDEWDEDFYYEVKYCPFCGSKIIVQIDETIDKTKEYEEMSNLRDGLNKKRRKTDSIKKERELSDQIKELDNKINKFYHSDGFSKK